MNSGTNKEYELLVQDDAVNYPDMNDNESPSHSAAIFQEELENEFHKQSDEDSYESDDSDISINRHRTLSNENLIPISKSKPSCKHTSNDHVYERSWDPSTPTPTIWTPTPMSPSRRAGVLASIMFAILIGSMFIWALPCNLMPFNSKTSIYVPWTAEFNGVVLIHQTFVQLINGNSYIMVVYMKERNNVYTVNASSLTNNSSVTSCGLVLVTEKMGSEIWRLGLPFCPHTVICDFDVTQDMCADCVIIGNNSMPLMVDVKNGTVAWTTEKNDNVMNFSVPLIIEDIDNDGIDDMLFAVNFISKKQMPSLLLVVSGKTGQVISGSMNFRECHEAVTLSNNVDSISYSCLIDGVIDTKEIPLSVLTENMLTNSNNSILTFAQTNWTQPMQQGLYDDACPRVYINKIGDCLNCDGSEVTNLKLPALPENTIGFDTKHVVINNECYGIIVKFWTHLVCMYFEDTSGWNIDTSCPSNNTDAEVHRIRETINYYKLNGTFMQQYPVYNVNIEQVCSGDCFPAESMKSNTILLNELDSGEDLHTIYVSTGSVDKTLYANGSIHWTPQSFLRKIVFRLL